MLLREGQLKYINMQELVCGHFMHSHCFAQYTRFDYTCPICCKSLGDMSVYFRMIDSMVAHDRITLPQAYRERKQVLSNFEKRPLRN